MFHQLVSHNNDIRQLVEKGYAVAFDSNYLVIRDIPYLDGQKKLQWGAIVSKIVFIDEVRIRQDDHQIFFAGSVPHNIDGSSIPNLGGGLTQLALSEACKDIVIQRSFSNKPKVAGKFHDFPDLFEKIESYVRIISGPAMELYKANPYTFKAVKEIVIDSVFKVHDTLSSRAEIGDLSQKFKEDVVAVIGVGGTGAYVLDFLVKTPVREIRAFDFDVFYVHNAFRSPGRLDPAELGKPKAEVYQSRYENFRIGISVQKKYIDASSIDDLAGVTFAFVCVDTGPSRKQILDLLLSKAIPFIDVGMGLNRKRGPLDGMLRITHFPKEQGMQVRDKKWVDEADNPDDLYRTNIQISELNALNACLAVIKFKQLRGFYVEETTLFHLLFGIADLKSVQVSNLNENSA